MEPRNYYSTRYLQESTETQSSQSQGQQPNYRLTPNNKTNIKYYTNIQEGYPSIKAQLKYFKFLDFFSD